jgi:hypothetical protein
MHRNYDYDNKEGTAIQLKSEKTRLLRGSHKYGELGDSGASREKVGDRIGREKGRSEAARGDGSGMRVTARVEHSPESQAGPDRQKKKGK